MRYGSQCYPETCLRRPYPAWIIMLEALTGFTLKPDNLDQRKRWLHDEEGLAKISLKTLANS